MTIYKDIKIITKYLIPLEDLEIKTEAYLNTLMPEIDNGNISSEELEAKAKEYILSFVDIRTEYGDKISLNIGTMNNYGEMHNKCKMG